MDSLVIQLDAPESSGPWRRLMHDNDVGAGAVDTAAIRLSQTLLAQGLGGTGLRNESTLTLKAKASDLAVDGRISASLRVDQGEDSGGTNDLPIRSPPSTATPEFESTTKRFETPSAKVMPQGSEVNSPTTLSTDSVTPPIPMVAAGAGTKPDQRSCVYTPGQVQYLPSSIATKTTPRSIGSPPRPSLKRARISSDVDGPYTSALGSKKRRLLRHLVTSRLSRLFSIPATHVPNLEGTVGMTGGGGMEKRFLRLAAVAAAGRVATSPTPSAAAQLRQQPHSTPPSEVLRRAAIINRLRMRVFVQAAQRGDAAVAEMAASAALLRFPSGVNAAAGGSGLARFPRPLASGPGQAEIAMPPPPRPSLPISSSSPPLPKMALFLSSPDDSTQAATTPSPAAASSREHSPYQARQRLASPTPFALPTAIAAAGPLSRVAAIARRRSISPGMTPPGSPSKGLRPADASPRTMVAGTGRLPSVSPRLQPLSSSDDEEGMAFPTSEHESRYESGDDLDDVYTDFSVVFGGDGGEDDDGMSGSEVDGYEEFMDDLDGIPWSAR